MSQDLNTLFGLITTIIITFISRKLVPMITNYVDNQKNVEIKNMYDTALNVAKNVVVPLAVDNTIGNSDKRTLAVQRLTNRLHELHIELPESTVSAIVERAYQAYKANGGDVHKLDVQASEDDQSEQDSSQNSSNNTATTMTGQAAPFNPYNNGGGNND